MISGKRGLGGFFRPESKSVSIAYVYLAVQFLHCDKVQGLEGVSCWGDEIKADVDPGVMVVKQRAFDLQLFLEIVFKLGVDVVHDWLITAERAKDKLDLCLFAKAKYFSSYSCAGNEYVRKYELVAG